MPFDFIADEEATTQQGFDFTPDPEPEADASPVAVAPRPHRATIRPPAFVLEDPFMAQTERKADLAAQMKEERQKGEYWEGVANRAGHVIEAFSGPYGGIARALDVPFDATINRNAPPEQRGNIARALGTPTINLPRAGEAETTPGKIAAGTYNAAAELIAGFSTPEMLTMLPAAASKPVLTAWISQMAGHAPERVLKANQLFKEGKTQEAVQEVAATIGELGMAEMGRRHVVREPGAPTRADVRQSEVMDPREANDIALQLTDPRQAQRRVVLPESMREAARPPAMPVRPAAAPEPAPVKPAAEPAAAETLPEQFRTKPVAETVDLVKGVTPEEMAAYKGSYVGGPTGFMWDLGAKAKTVEDVAALRKMAEDASAETKALMKAGDLEGAMKVIGRQPAEAYEFATGVKLDGTPKWSVLEKLAADRGQTYKPPVPDAQYLKAKGEAAPETAARPAEPAAIPSPAPEAAPLPGDLPALARLRITKPELRPQIDAKIAELEKAASGGTAFLRKELPPVPAGHVRLFHGEGGAAGGGTGGAFYTSNLAKAATFGPDVSWVDLPTDKAQAAFARAKGTAFAGGDNFVLEAADIQRAQKIGKKVEPPTHVLDEPVASSRHKDWRAESVETFQQPDGGVFYVDRSKPEQVRFGYQAPEGKPMPEHGGLWKSNAEDLYKATGIKTERYDDAKASELRHRLVQQPEAPKGIAASARQPGALARGGEAGAISLAPLKAAAAGAKAASDTVGNIVRFYSEPLTERLAAEGGANAKGFANMSKEVAQRAKELFGSLTPTLDPALEATGKMNRTTTWLNDISQVGNKRWGYRNAQKAVEGPIANVPAAHRPTVDLLKSANLAIGQLVQPVVPGFRATGRYQRPPTAFLVDTIRSGKGPNFDLLANALAEQNRILPNKVKDILREIKKEFDEPGSQQTQHRIAQEFERHFPKFPTDLKVKTPLGDVWMPILHAKPFEYLQNAAQTTAQRVAFLERVPQGTLKGIREQVVSELKDPAAFDDLVRALHGLPVNEPLRMFTPGSIQQMIAAGSNRVLTDVFSSLKLTASAIYNIPETVLGNTPAFFGWRNFIEGAATLKGRHDRLENLGAINRAIYNFSFDPKAPVRSVLNNFRQGVRKTTMQQFFNEMQEMLAASTAQVFSERAKGQQLSPREQGLFTEAATAMGFARPAARTMAEGRGTAEQYGDFTRRAASFTTGGNIQPAEMSRFGGNRVLTSLFRFQSYPMMKLNAFRKAYVNFAEAIESKDSGRIKASSEQMAKFLFNTSAQGAATAFLAALLTGRGGGVEQVADDAKDDPAKFIFDSVASGIGGPVSAINYAVGTGKAGDLVNPKNINAGSTFPGSIYLELKQMFNTEGPYSGMTLKQAAKKYARTKIPAGRMINHALEEAGLIGSEETRRNNLLRLYDKWLKKQTDPKIKADYERAQTATYPVSKYKSLDSALADRNESAAVKAINHLIEEGQKPRDILKRMRPFVGEGINSRQKPLFHESHKMETAFRNSLTSDQRAEYQRAVEERRLVYQEFLKAWRKRGGPAPATAPKFDFVPDAAQ